MSNGLAAFPVEVEGRFFAGASRAPRTDNPAQSEPSSGGGPGSNVLAGFLTTGWQDAARHTRYTVTLVGFEGLTQFMPVTWPLHSVTVAALGRIQAEENR